MSARWLSAFVFLTIVPFASAKEGDDKTVVPLG